MTSDDFLTEVAEDAAKGRRKRRVRLAGGLAAAVLLLAIGVAVGGVVFGGHAEVPTPSNAGEPGVIVCGKAEDDCAAQYLGQGRWIIAPRVESETTPSAPASDAEGAGPVAPAVTETVTETVKAAGPTTTATATTTETVQATATVPGPAGATVTLPPTVQTVTLPPTVTTITVTPDDAGAADPTETVVPPTGDDGDETPPTTVMPPDGTDDPTGGPTDGPTDGPTGATR